MSGRHKQVMCALHHLIGAAVASASQWRRLNMFMKSVVKGMQPFGVHYSKSVHVVGAFLVKKSVKKLFNFSSSPVLRM